MVYTYIDRDHCSQLDAITNAPSKGAPSRPPGCKSMFICLATEVDGEHLLKEALGEYSRHFSQHILLELAIHQDGLVEVCPGLSKALSEPSHTLPMDLGVQYAHTQAHGPQANLQPLNLFLDDYTIKAAQAVGFGMSSLRIKSRLGAEYEYVIYNAKEVLNPLAAEQALLRGRMIDGLKAAENLSTPAPAVREERDCYLEICSASGFGCDALFVTYSLPAAKGCTATALVNHHLPLRLSRDSWLSKHDCVVGGLLYLLLACAGIVIGAEYLVFVVLALGLLFVCQSYNSYMPAPLVVTEGCSTKGSKGVQRFIDYLPLPSYLQRPTTTTSTLHEDRAVFNHLLSFSCSTAEEVQQPQVVQLEVFAAGLVPQCVGYGSFALPSAAGGFNVQIATVLPVAPLRGCMQEHFLGGAAAFKEPAAWTKGSYSGGNRLGVLTTSSGTICLRGQIVNKVPVPVRDEEAKAAASAVPQQVAKMEKAATKRTVEDILASFRASTATDGSKLGKKDLVAAALRPVSISKPTEERERPSIQQILASLGRKSTPEEVPDKDKAAATLARIRAKQAQSAGQGQGQGVQMSDMPSSRLPAAKAQKERKAGEEEEEHSEQAPLLSTS